MGKFEKRILTGGVALFVLWATIVSGAVGVIAALAPDVAWKMVLSLYAIGLGFGGLLSVVAIGLLRNLGENARLRAAVDKIEKATEKAESRVDGLSVETQALREVMAKETQALREVTANETKALRASMEKLAESARILAATKEQETKALLEAKKIDAQTRQMEAGLASYAALIDAAGKVMK